MKKQYIILPTIALTLLITTQTYNGMQRNNSYDEILNETKVYNTVKRYEPRLETKELILDEVEISSIMQYEKQKDIEAFSTKEELPTLNTKIVQPITIDKKKLDNNYNISTKINKLVSTSKELLGTPYVWGGTKPHKGMDCSGFTQYVMKQVGYNIPRVSKDQSKYGKLVPRNKLLPGDLLFFDTTNPRDASDIKTPTQELQYAYEVEKGYKPTTVSHVGIYLGDGVMIHASSGDGRITYADLSSNYYKNRFINARRIIK